MKIAKLAWLAAIVCIAGPAAAQPAGPGHAGPSPAAHALERFAQQSGNLCETAPSTRCVDAVFRFADANHDGRLSVQELEYVRAAIGDWLQWRGDTLTEDEQTRAAFGIMIVDTLGIPAIVQSYDQDGDGALTQHEALADVRLDRRPIAEVLGDPNAVNRAALQQRLGVMGAMTDNMFPH